MHTNKGPEIAVLILYVTQTRSDSNVLTVVLTLFSKTVTHHASRPHSIGQRNRDVDEEDDSARLMGWSGPPVMLGDWNR